MTRGAGQPGEPEAERGAYMRLEDNERKKMLTIFAKNLPRAFARSACSRIRSPRFDALSPRLRTLFAFNVAVSTSHVRYPPATAMSIASIVHSMRSRTRSWSLW